MATPPASPSMGAKKAPELDRERLVQLILGMLRKRGEVMAAELERRIDAKKPLEVKGVKVDVSMLEEAMDLWDSEQGGPKPEAATESSSSTAPVAAAGARWMPAAPSSSLLAARALAECEQAEVFGRSVRVVGGASLPVLPKPDVLVEPIKGETVASGQIVEVVARYASPKDGRVYLRLKAQAGWISTRSHADFAKVVVAPLKGQASVEPQRCLEPIESTALTFLPPVDGSAAVLAPPGVPPAGGSPAAAVAAAAAAAAAAAQAPDCEDGEEAAITQDTDDDHDEGSEEEDGDMDEEMDGEDELDGDEGAPPKSPAGRGGAGSSAAASGPSPGGGAEATSPARKVVQEKRFKVILTRIPVLSVPCADQLMGTGHFCFLEQKEEFVSDGVCHVPAENRVYLRIKGGRGWVCERSRNDIRRLAVVPITRRKHKLSKKMAKAVAFRGGDTDGVTRLKKEDLVKNSHGKIVSKKASEAAKKRYADSGAAKWNEAVKRARIEMGVSGFCAVKKGTPLYERAQAIVKGQPDAPATASL